MSKVLVIMDYDQDLPVAVLQMSGFLTADETFCAWYRDQGKVDKDMSDSDLMDGSISGCTMLWADYEVEHVTDFAKRAAECAASNMRRNGKPKYFC